MAHRKTNFERKAEAADEISGLIENAHRLVRERQPIQALEITNQLKARLDKNKTKINWKTRLLILVIHAKALEKNKMIKEAIAIQRIILSMDLHRWTTYLVIAALERQLEDHIGERKTLESFFVAAKKASVNHQPTQEEYEQAKNARGLNYARELFPLIKKAHRFLDTQQPDQALEITKQLKAQLDRDKEILNNGTQFSILMVHAKVLEIKKQFQNAIDNFKKIFEVDPYHWKTFFSVATLERRLSNRIGEYQILKSFFAAAKEAPQDKKPSNLEYAQAFNSLALYHRNDDSMYLEDKLKIALDYALQAEKCDPKYDGCLATLAHIYQESGNEVKAREYFDKACHANPSRLEENHPTPQPVNHVRVESKTEPVKPSAPFDKIEIREVETKKPNLLIKSESLALVKPQQSSEETKVSANGAGKTKFKAQEQTKAPKKHASTTQAAKKYQEVSDEKNVHVANSLASLPDASNDSTLTTPTLPKLPSAQSKNEKPNPIAPKQSAAVEKKTEPQKQKNRQTDNCCIRLRNGFFSRVSACSNLASSTIASVAGYLGRRQ